MPEVCSDCHQVSLVITIRLFTLQAGWKAGGRGAFQADYGRALLEMQLESLSSGEDK